MYLIRTLLYLSFRDLYISSISLYILSPCIDHFFWGGVILYFAIITCKFVSFVCPVLGQHGFVSVSVDCPRYLGHAAGEGRGPVTEQDDTGHSLNSPSIF